MGDVIPIPNRPQEQFIGPMAKPVRNSDIPSQPQELEARLVQDDPAVWAVIHTNHDKVRTMRSIPLWLKQYVGWLEDELAGRLDATTHPYFNKWPEVPGE